MRERPILKQNRGPDVATAPIPATGGENLGNLIAQADALRLELGYQRWADLKPLCDGEDPRTIDRRGLVKLIGLLGKEKSSKRYQQLTIFDPEGQGHV